MSALKLVLWGFLAVLGSVALAFVVWFRQSTGKSKWSLAGRGGGLYLCAGVSFLWPLDFAARGGAERSAGDAGGAVE